MFNVLSTFTIYKAVTTVLATNVNAINLIINVSLLLGAIAVILKFLRPIYKGGKKALEFWFRFQDDWEGQKARDGKARIPGVMEQLNSHELSIQYLYKVLKEIKPELFEEKDKV